jgi:hypothetical protein
MSFTLCGDRVFWLDSDGNVGWSKPTHTQCDLTVRAGASEFAVDDAYVYADRGREVLTFAPTAELVTWTRRELARIRAKVPFLGP